MKARVAMLDYLFELRRQQRGVRPVPSTSYIDDPFKVPEQAKPLPETRPDTGVTSHVTKLRYAKGEAPAMAYVRSLGMDAKVASEVAEELQVSTNLVRKWVKDPAVKAPSYEVPYGKNKIYLFTPEDVDELRAFQARQRTPLPRQRVEENRQEGHARRPEERP